MPDPLRSMNRIRLTDESIGAEIMMKTCNFKGEAARLLTLTAVALLMAGPAWAGSGQEPWNWWSWLFDWLGGDAVVIGGGTLAIGPF